MYIFSILFTRGFLAGFNKTTLVTFDINNFYYNLKVSNAVVNHYALR